MTRNTDAMTQRWRSRLAPMSNMGLAAIAKELESQCRFADAAMVWAELDRRETLIVEMAQQDALCRLMTAKPTPMTIPTPGPGGAR